MKLVLGKILTHAQAIQSTQSQAATIPGKKGEELTLTLNVS